MVAQLLVYDFDEATELVFTGSISLVEPDCHTKSGVTLAYWVGAI